ncbi:MAG: hypothetical protein ACYTGW_15050 [Planctomycetota bacterium]
MGLKLLALWFVVRFFWDAWALYHTIGSPAFSVPKMGIAVILLPLAWVLLREKVWAVCLAGMVCLFWLGFAVARTAGLLMPGAAPPTSYPWSNWVALPAVLYLLHYVQRLVPDKPAPPDKGPAAGPPVD